MKSSSVVTDLKGIGDLAGEIVKTDERQRELIATYIQEIAHEAKSLASLWREVVYKLKDAESVDISTNPRIVEEIERHRWGQMPPFYRLRDFYEKLNEVTCGTLSRKYADNILIRLSSLLNHREITKNLYDEAIQELKTNILVSKHVRPTDYKQLMQSVNELDKEAAAIHVLADTIRALPAAGKQRFNPTFLTIIMLLAILINNVVWVVLTIYK